MNNQLSKEYNNLKTKYEKFSFSLAHELEILLNEKSINYLSINYRIKALVSCQILNDGKNNYLYQKNYGKI